MRIFLVLSFAFAILLCSCVGNKPAETTENVTADTSAATVVTEPDVSSETTTYENVEVITPTIAPGVDVKYEVLTLDDKELQAILEAESKNILAKYIPNISSVNELGGTAEYDVKLEGTYQGENILSAVFSGSYAIYYENSEEGGEVLYTVNIDTTTGKLLNTSDIVDFNKMVEAFNSGRFDVSPDFSQYSSDYEIYPYVYLTKDRFTVCVTKSGMYEEVLRYSVSYSDADDFLKIGD